MMNEKDDIRGNSTQDIIQQNKQKKEKLNDLSSQEPNQKQFINFIDMENNTQKQEQKYKIIQKKTIPQKISNNKQKQKKNKTFQKLIKKKPIKKQNKQKKTNQKGKDKRKNDTNNTIKNYGGSIITFINQNSKIIAQAKKSIIQEIKMMNVDQGSIEIQITQTQRIFLLFDQDLEKINKKQIKQKQNLVDLWTKKQYSKLMRIVSCVYFRKYCYYWIFNSRIENYQNAIKYKSRLQQILRDPYTPQTLKWASNTPQTLKWASTTI